MRPLALAVSLCLAACVHASPIQALGSAATAHLQPSPAAQAAGIQAVAHLTTHRPTFATIAPVAQEAGLEALASVPAVTAAAVASPGVFGVLRGVWEAVKANPTLDLLVLMALLDGFFALAKFFHWISGKRAKQIDGVVTAGIAVAEPIAKETANVLDDLAVAVAKKFHVALEEIIAGDPDKPLPVAVAEAHAVVLATLPPAA